MSESVAEDRKPPQDLEAEAAVLGAMLLSAEAIADVVEILKPNDFYRPRHSRIYEVILALFSESKPVDGVTVASMLGDKLNAVGGVPYLHTLVEQTPNVASAGYYARLVYERAVMRRVVETGIMISQLGQSQSGSGREVAETVELAQQAMLEITAVREHGDFVSLADAIEPALEDIEAAGQAGDGMSGVPTGFRDLDRLLQGLQAGQLIVVAGRPGLGKSTIAMDFVRNAAIREKMPAAFFSLEMSNVEMVMRLLSAECKVPLHLLRSGALADSDWSRMGRRIGEIGDAPIFFDDSPGMNLMEIRAKAKRLKQQHNLKLLVVDYLQLMSSPKQGESRQQEVSGLSRGLKLLGKEIGCPIIAVSQLNRGPEQRQDKRPQLSDLRESGSIEQDADVVILLHRDDYYDKESPRAGEADFIVAKHRNGATDTVTVAAQLHLSRFVDMSIDPEPGN